MRVPIYSKILMGLAVLTLLAPAAHQLLPEKKWDWLPADNLVSRNYADNVFGGNSTSQWVNESELHLACETRPTGKSFPPFCGFHVYLSEDISKYVDLTSYSRMIVDLDYVGDNQKLRFYINEFEPGFSDPEDPIGTRTAKYMSVYATAAETLNPFTIKMDEFVVADWWINEHNVPRHLSVSHRKRVMTFGVDIAYPTALGHHEIKLKSVQFVGEWVSAEQWYLGILLLWALVLVIASIIRMVDLMRYNKKLQLEKAKYEHLSTIDSLTGLLNRNGINEWFLGEMQSVKALRPVGVLVVDVDYFKNINDTYGHAVGDEILQDVAKTMKSSLREEDRAARWGGEEFLILLPGSTTESSRISALRLCENIRSVRHPELNGQRLTVSVGVSEVHDNETLDEAFARADAALYHAKNSGRDRVVTEFEVEQIKKHPNIKLLSSFNRGSDGRKRSDPRPVKSPNK